MRTTKRKKETERDREGKRWSKEGHLFRFFCFFNSKRPIEFSLAFAEEKLVGFGKMLVAKETL